MCVYEVADTIPTTTDIHVHVTSTRRSFKLRSSDDRNANREERQGVERFLPQNLLSEGNQAFSAYLLPGAEPPGDDRPDPAYGVLRLLL